MTTTDTHTSPTVTVPDRDSWVITYFSDKSSSTTAWTPPAGVAVRTASYGTGSGYITSLLVDGGAPVAAGTVAGGLTARTNVAGSRGNQLDRRDETGGGMSSSLPVIHGARLGVRMSAKTTSATAGQIGGGTMFVSTRRRFLAAVTALSTAAAGVVVAVAGLATPAYAAPGTDASAPVAHDRVVSSVPASWTPQIKDGQVNRHRPGGRVDGGGRHVYAGLAEQWQSHQRASKNRGIQRHERRDQWQLQPQHQRRRQRSRAGTDDWHGVRGRVLLERQRGDRKGRSAQRCDRRDGDQLPCTRHQRLGPGHRQIRQPALRGRFLHHGRWHHQARPCHAQRDDGRARSVP